MGVMGVSCLLFMIPPVLVVLTNMQAFYDLGPWAKTLICVQVFSGFLTSLLSFLGDFWLTRVSPEPLSGKFTRWFCGTTDSEVQFHDPIPTWKKHYVANRLDIWNATFQSTSLLTLGVWQALFGTGGFILNYLLGLSSFITAACSKWRADAQWEGQTDETGYDPVAIWYTHFYHAIWHVFICISIGLI